MERLGEDGAAGYSGGGGYGYGSENGGGGGGGSNGAKGEDGVDGAGGAGSGVRIDDIPVTNFVLSPGEGGCPGDGCPGDGTRYHGCQMPIAKVEDVRYLALWA